MNARNQGGFTLLEVLVALLVLSIGLLGLAALQTVGLKFNHQSYQRTQAVILAYDIIDRIRANPQAKDTYSGIGPSSTASGDCTSNACTPAQLAAADAQEWLGRLRQTVAQGQGAVCRGTIDTSLTCSPTGKIWRIAVRWTEDDLPMRIDVETEL